MINTFGYRVDVGKIEIKRLACQLQNVRREKGPIYLLRSVQYYVLGKIRFSLCLKWTRGCPKDIDELRYFCAMSITAATGQTALEILGSG